MLDHLDLFPVFFSWQLELSVSWNEQLHRLQRQSRTILTPPKEWLVLRWGRGSSVPVSENRRVLGSDLVGIRLVYMAVRTRVSLGASVSSLTPSSILHHSRKSPLPNQSRMTVGLHKLNICLIFIAIPTERQALCTTLFFIFFCKNRAAASVHLLSLPPHPNTSHGRYQSKDKWLTILFA